MNRVQIIIDNIHGASGNFPVWSTLSIKIDDKYFPSKNWCDATSSVLVMWTQCLSKIISLKSDREILCFMDGDYSFEIKYIATNSCQLTFYGLGSENFPHADVDLTELCIEVLHACNKIIGWRQEDQSSYPVRELYTAVCHLSTQLGKQ